MGIFEVRQRGWRPGAAVVARVMAVVCVVAVVGAAPHSARAELLWSGAVRVDPAPKAAVEWSPSLSCVSAASCVLVDGAGRASRYDGRRWSAPATIDPGQQLRAVSCASPSFCVAVDATGHELTYDGSVWHSPFAIDPGRLLTSVSCATTSFCLAVDDRGNAVTWNGSGWSPPTNISPSGASWNLGPVSCPVAGFCAVAYSYPNGAECLEPVGPGRSIDDGSPGVDGLLVLDDGQWGQPQQLYQILCDYHTPVEPPVVTSLSCASASFCVAVDTTESYWNYDGTGWRETSTGGRAFQAVLVACPSTAQCEGFDDNTTEAEDGGLGFSDPQLIWASGGAVSVSCPSTAFCAAVDAAGKVVLGTAAGPLVTLTVGIDVAGDSNEQYVAFTGPTPACRLPADPPCTRAWRPGTAVTLTGSDPDGGDPLLGWTGGGCSGTGTCTPTLQSDTTVTAVFTSAATSALANIGDPGRDTLRSLRAGGTPRRADLLLAGQLRIVWTAGRRVLATARIAAAAPGIRTLRLRLTDYGRSRLSHARHTLIGWRAVFSASDGHAVTDAGSGHLR